MGLDLLVAIVCHVVPVAIAIIFIKSKIRGLRESSLRDGSRMLLGDRDRDNGRRAKILDKEHLKNPDVANPENISVPSVPTSPAMRDDYDPDFPAANSVEKETASTPSVGGGVGGGAHMLGFVNVIGALGQSGTMSNRFIAASQITGAVFQGGSKIYNIKPQGVRNLEQGGSQILNAIENRKRLTIKQKGNSNARIQNGERGRLNLNGKGNSKNYIYGNGSKVRIGKGDIHTGDLQIKGASRVHSMLANRFIAPKAAKVKIHQLASMNTMDNLGEGMYGDTGQTRRLNGGQRRKLKTKPSKNTYSRLHAPKDMNATLNASQGANINTRVNASSANTRLNASSGANVNARFTGRANVPTNPRFSQIPKQTRRMINTPRVNVTNNRQNTDITLNDLNTHKIQKYNISKNDSTIQANQLLTMASIRRVYEDPRNRELQGRQKSKFYVASKIMENERVHKSGEDDYGYINKSNNDEQLLRIAASNFKDLDANELVKTVRRAREYQGNRESRDRNYAKKMVREKSAELNSSNRLAIEGLLKDTSGEVGMHFDNLIKDMSALTDEQIREIEQKAEQNVKERENLSPEERKREYEEELEKLKKEKLKENEESYRELEIEKMLNDDEEARAILGEEGFEKFKKSVKDNGRKAFQDELRKKRNQDDYYYKLKHQEHKELNPYELHQERIKSEQEEDIQSAVNDLYREKGRNNVNRVGPTPVPPTMYMPPRTNTENPAV